jgi:Protein of unknown function (DUF3383)
VPAIPASQIVQVVPSVIGAGGDALDLSGLILTNSTRTPIGAVSSFPDQLSVANYFGATSQEANLASIYFNGFDTSTVKPGALLFSQYPAAPVGAWLRGGNLAGMTLAQLQALSGSLNVTVDGVAKTAASLNFSGVTSFSAAAAAIATALTLTALPGATVTGSIATTVLTVTAVASGVLAAGQTISGGTITAGTTIVAQLTSTAAGGALGNTGTYTVSASQTVASTTVTATNPPCTYDSGTGAFQINSATSGATSTMSFASGTLAAPLLLTQATGAVTSQGAIAAVPATAMNAIIAITQDWAAFMTTWEPSTSDKVAFSAWTNTQGNEYLYVMWTTNAAATVVPDTTTAGAQIRAAQYSGTALVYQTGTDGDIAAFILGYTASLNFAATNGRATAMFRSGLGIAPDITDGTISQNLRANGYNFYGDWSLRNDDFIFLANGVVTGPYAWLDSYLNQIWFNNQLQLALMSLLKAVNSIPYNQAGYTLIRTACLDPIIAAVNFGAIRAGVTLSNQQAAIVNTAAGVKIDDVLNTRGWYLQVNDPTPQVRAQRGTPVCNLWYMDGQSVQRIVLASIEVM